MTIKKTVKPGIYAGIPNADYHSGEGISKSGLDIVRRSPLHYKASKEAEQKESTPDQRIGTMAHDLILEPDTFWDRYARPFIAPESALVTMDDIKIRLKDLGEKVSGKKDELIERLRAVDSQAVFLDDLKAAYLAENEGKEIITEEEFVRVESMRDSVMSHPVAGKLLDGNLGIAEMSCYWNDPKTGVLCRVRPDFWRDDDIIVDLKTARDASPEGFPRAVQEWRYNVQEAFYTDGIAAAIKQGNVARKTPKAFVFVVVEKVLPFAVSVYRLDSESVDIGRREYREDLDAFAACEASGVWTGYGEKIQMSGLPKWRLRQENFSEGEAA